MEPRAFGDGRQFAIKSRAVDADVMIEKIEVVPTVPISLDSHIMIHYCPWCGTKLSVFYESVLTAVQ